MAGNTLSILFAVTLTLAGNKTSARAVDDCRLGWDTTIGQPGVSSGKINVMLSYDDGSGPGLYIAGDFDEIGGVAVHNIARWTGETFQPVGDGLTTDESSGGEVRALCVYDDGNGPALYAGGYFQYADGQPVGFSLARWDGKEWNAVGGGLVGNTPQVNAMVVYDDGTGPALVIGGQLRSPDAEINDGIVAWDGTTYRSFAEGLGGSPAKVNALAILATPDFVGGDNWLIMGGHFQRVGDQVIEGVAKWDGTAWSALGEGIDGSISTVTDLLVFDDGTGLAAYMTGNFTLAGGQAVSSAARWYWGNTWSGLGDDYLSDAKLVSFDAGGGPDLYAATAAGFRVWRHSDWEEASPGVWGIRDLAVFDDGTGHDALFVGGAFNGINGVAVNRLARWRCTCDADLNGSGGVDYADLISLLSAWGPCPDCAQDVDGDGTVDLGDLQAALESWGACW